MEMVTGLPASILRIDSILSNQLAQMRMQATMESNDPDKQTHMPQSVQVKPKPMARIQHENLLGGLYQHTHSY